MHMVDYPTRDQICIGSAVLIETKENQGTGKFTKGIVNSILTRSKSHPYGIKVRLHDGNVGRVKEMLTEKQDQASKDPNNSKQV